MRRKAASREQNSAVIEKAVEVATNSDCKLDEGLLNAAQGSATAVVSKRGRKKAIAENAKSSELNDAEENNNSDKAVTVPKRGRKPANKNAGDAKDANAVSERTTDDLKSEKSNEDLKKPDSSESQAVDCRVPKEKNFTKQPVKRGRKKAENEAVQKSAEEDGDSNTTKQVPEQEAVQADKEKSLSSDESDFQLPSHLNTKNAEKNTKKKPGPVKGKKSKNNDTKDANEEENMASNETENVTAVDDIYVNKNNAKSNPPSKRGRKRKNDGDDKETKQSSNQDKNNPPKSDVLEDDNAGIIEEVIEMPKRGKKAVKNIPTEATNASTEGEAKTIPNPKGRSSKRKVDKSDEDEKEKVGKIPKKEDSSKKASKKEKIPDVTALDFNSKSTTSGGEPWNLKISSWNINGIRAWLEKDGITYLHHENPDILCVQETKCADEKLPAELKNMNEYHAYWLAGDKDGYSGVGLLSKEKPLNVEYGIGISEHDKEGRVITAEYEKFFLIAAYVPNAGRGLVRLDYRMQWDKDFRNYLKKLDEKKPIVLCGDLNVAHEELDLANPKSNKKSAGFTKEEREGFSTLLKQEFVDTFRFLYPDTKGAYTFWTYMMNARAKNVGWRLDYFVISKRFNENLCDSVIRKDVYGSDHCPITLFLAV